MPTTGRPAGPICLRESFISFKWRRRMTGAKWIEEEAQQQLKNLTTSPCWKCVFLSIDGTHNNGHHQKLRLFLHSTARETIIHFFRCARLFEICFVLKAAQGDSDYKPCRARENNPALCTDDSSSCPTMQREQRGIFFPMLLRNALGVKLMLNVDAFL